MKTYRNEQLGFEIDIPDDWSFHSEGKERSPASRDHSLIFKCSPNEAFNIQIGPLKPEPSLKQTENEFERYAREKGYMSLGLGRITVGGKEHVCACYYMGGGSWVKKYMIVLNEIEYTITATCLDQKYLLEMEKDWDAVAGSFREIKEKAAESETLERRKESPIEPVVETKNAKTGGLSKENTRGVKTYRNDELGIEIDVPSDWSLPEKAPLLTQNGAEIIFGCGANQAFYITVKESTARLSAEQTKLKFREYALDKGYSRLELGRFALGEDDHVWVRYYMGDNIWVKKYIVSSDEAHYEITASCTEPAGNRIRFDQK